MRKVFFHKKLQKIWFHGNFWAGSRFLVLFHNTEAVNNMQFFSSNQFRVKFFSQKLISRNFCKKNGGGSKNSVIFTLCNNKLHFYVKPHEHLGKKFVKSTIAHWIYYVNSYKCKHCKNVKTFSRFFCLKSVRENFSNFCIFRTTNPQRWL